MATSTRKSAAKKKPGRPPKPRAKTSTISFAGERFHVRLPGNTEVVMRFGGAEANFEDGNDGANFQLTQEMIEWTLSLFDRGDGTASRESSQRRMYDLMATGRAEVDEVLDVVLAEADTGTGRQSGRARPLE